MHLPHPHWMDNPAFGFWGLVVGLVGIIAAIWAAWRYGDAGRSLYYRLEATTAIVRRDLAVSVEVSQNGVVLNDPVVTKLILVAPNRSDITEDVFAKGQPLTFSFGPPVLEVLGISYEPADCPVPAVVNDESGLHIGPDPLHGKSTLEVSLLFDGWPKMQLPQRTLTNVKLKHGVPRRGNLLMSALTVSVSLVIFLWLISLIASGPGPGVAVYAFAAVVGFVSSVFVELLQKRKSGSDR